MLLLLLYLLLFIIAGSRIFCCDFCRLTSNLHKAVKLLFVIVIVVSDDNISLLLFLCCLCSPGTFNHALQFRVVVIAADVGTNAVAVEPATVA